MTASQLCIDKIKAFEGLSLRAYRCPAGVLTIGYGNTSMAKRYPTITREQADLFLKADIANVEKALARLNLPQLTQYQWDAIVDFCFNLGVGNFAKSTLLRKIRINTKDLTIPFEFKRWVYSNGKKLAGLEKRRAWESERWRGKE